MKYVMIRGLPADSGLGLTVIFNIWNVDWLYLLLFKTVLLRIFCHVMFALSAMYTAYVIYGHGHASSLLFLVRYK